MSRRDELRVEFLEDGRTERLVVGRLVVATSGPGFVDLSGAIRHFVGESGLQTGLATLFCRHTSASLAIQENASPDVLRDLVDGLDRLAPRSAAWLHRDEGPDDMPAHLRTLLTDSSLCVPILEGRPALGTWQAIYLVEHRDAPHRREILVNLTGK